MKPEEMLEIVWVHLAIFSNLRKPRSRVVHEIKEMLEINLLTL